MNKTLSSQKTIRGERKHVQQRKCSFLETWQELRVEEIGELRRSKKQSLERRGDHKAQKQWSRKLGFIFLELFQRNPGGALQRGKGQG